MAELWHKFFFFCHNSQEGAVLIYPKLYTYSMDLYQSKNANISGGFFFNLMQHPGDQWTGGVQNLKLFHQKNVKNNDTWVISLSGLQGSHCLHYPY